MTTIGARILTAPGHQAASQMKSFTAAVVLQLVQEHRIRLDDPVDRLIPERFNYSDTNFFLAAYSWAAGGLSTTAEASATFYCAQFGGRLLRPAPGDTAATWPDTSSTRGSARTPGTRPFS
jgi:hypothetical protein